MPKKDVSRFLRSLSFMLLSALVAWSSSAQEPNLFFDSVDVNLVNIEVIVTDKDGEPVTDLKQEEFMVSEDTEPMEISHFLSIRGGEPVREAEVESQGREDPAPEPETQKLRLVIFIDNINMEPRRRNIMFKKLKMFLREDASPGREVMLASLSGKVSIEQGFTDDTELLISALDRMGKKLGIHPLMTERQRFVTEMLRAELVDLGQATGYNRGAANVNDNNFLETARTAERLGQTAYSLAERRFQLVRTSVDALGQFCNSLAGLPGRKAILYVSDGLHVRPADGYAQAYRSKYESWIIRNNGTRQARQVDDRARELETLRFDATRDFQDLVEFASGLQVSFYPLSNLNLGTDLGLSAEHRGVGEPGGAGGGPFSTSYAAMDTMSREGSLVHMADGTGGKAMTRTYEIGSMIGQIQQDFENFYSIGYLSPAPVGDGAYRKISVRLKRKDLKVRYLQGRQDRDPLDVLKGLTLAAAQHEMVENTLGVQLLSASEPTPIEGSKGRFQVPLMVRIPFESLLLLPKDTIHEGRVSLFVMVQDQSKGALSEPVHIELPIQIPNDRLAETAGQAVGYPLTLQLDSGPKRIALGARDNLARVNSTVSTEMRIGVQN